MTYELKRNWTTIFLIISVILTIMMVAGLILSILFGGEGTIRSGALFDEGEENILPYGFYEIELEAGTIIEITITSNEPLNLYIFDNNGSFSFPFDEEDAIKYYENTMEETVEITTEDDDDLSLVIVNNNMEVASISYEYWTYFDTEDDIGISVYSFCFVGMIGIFILIDLILLVKIYIDKKVEQNGQR
jgi:hypothetical protein